MHIILQDMFYEQGMQDLKEFLDVHGEQYDITYSVHKVVPFIGELIPDIDPNDDHVVCFGSYSLKHVAKRKGWSSGVWDLGNLTYRDYVSIFGDLMLNSDAVQVPTWRAAGEIPENEIRFVRPAHDNKFFSGGLMTRGEFKERLDLLENIEYDEKMFNIDTPVIIAKPKKIIKEIRHWIVDERISTSSIYKIGSRVSYQKVIDAADFWSFGFPYLGLGIDKYDLFKRLFPRAFVCDVAILEDGTKKIVEFNTLNASGFYAADVTSLIMDLKGVK